MQVDRESTVTLDTGSVEYDLGTAAVPIQDLIDLLESAKGEGAEYVVGTSGNFRGAKWARIGSMYGWADDE